MSKLINEYENHIAIIAGEHKVTFDEMLRRISMFSRHTSQNAGTKTIVLSENREGWIYAFYSIWNNHGIAVPVDATSTCHDISYIIKDCEPECVWTSRKKYDLVSEAIRESGRQLKILLIDDYERVELTDEKPADLDYEMDNVGLICYTSGTTGSPKGVMLTYRNMLANVRSVSTEVEIFSPKIRTIVLLPLHHVLPLMGSVIVPMETGGGVAICPSLTAADIMGTLQNAHVGLMIGVPRLWQLLYNGIKKVIDAHFYTRWLFTLCEKVDNRSFSKLIFGSVHKKMGGVRFCVSGGAPLDKDTALGLKTLGLDLLEGYGMTETAPIISFTRPGCLIPGSVGLAMPSVEVKLVDGELCARGENLMKGYYNRPEETAEVIDADGFIHTGDLAEIDADGHIFITGRKKEIIVTPGGKNINPVEIEFKLEKNIVYIKECAVILNGESLTAVIVPHDDIANSMSEDEIEQLMKDKVIVPYNNDTAPYKKIVAVYIYKGDLPRTKMEKLQRYKLQALVESGQHKAPRQEDFVEPTFEEYQILKEYLVEEKKLEQVRPTDNLETDLGLDSLDKISLQGFLEQTFGLNISADDIAKFKCIQELAEHISDYKTCIEVSQTDWTTLLKENTNTVKIPHMWWTGPVIAHGFGSYIRKHNGFTVKGLDNVPANGPYIIAPNHQSYMDGLLVPAVLSTKAISNLYFYAKSQHVRESWKQFLAGKHNIIIMDMSSLKDSIQQLGEVLKTGHNLCIFPEGTRTKTGKVGKFKKTFAILSKELDIPVVPVVIKGAFEAMPKGSKKLGKHPIVVEFLSPMKANDEQNYEDFADDVRKAIISKI